MFGDCYDMMSTFVKGRIGTFVCIKIIDRFFTQALTVIKHGRHRFPYIVVDWTFFVRRSKLVRRQHHCSRRYSVAYRPVQDTLGNPKDAFVWLVTRLAHNHPFN